MNWSVFGIVAYLLLVIQYSLAALFSQPLANISPQFILVLAVLVGLFAPARFSILAWAILGLLVDAMTVYGNVTLIGPYVLGYLVGGYVVLQLRTMVFRRHPLTMAFVIMLSGAAVELVVVLLLSIRGMYDPIIGFSALPQLGYRTLAVLYSAAFGLVMAVLLLKLVPLFGFEPSKRGMRSPGRWTR